MKPELWSKNIPVDGRPYFLFYTGADADSAIIFPKPGGEFSVTMFYANPRSTVDGPRFNSMREAKEYAERILFRLN